LFCIFEPIAFSFGFDDVTTVCQSIEGGASDALVDKVFGLQQASDQLGKPLMGKRLVSSSLFRSPIRKGAL
jgi:hypothetical protein